MQHIKRLYWGAFIYFIVISFSAKAENMCSTVTSSAAVSGSLYDSGGSGSNYQNDEDCTFLIQPSGASSVTLAFSDLTLESGYDYLYLYDGTSTSSPLITPRLTGSGTGTYTASSGAMLVRFSSGHSVVDRGFSAAWTATIPAPDLPTVRAAWYFDEIDWAAIAGEVLDSSGNTFHGVASQVMTNSADGVVCNAADFRENGTNDYASLNSDALSGLTNFSISIWGRLDSSRTQAQTIFSAASREYQNEVLMYFANIGNLQLHFRNRVVASYTLPAINDDVWHHYVWTRDGGTHCLFMDGVNQGCQTSTYTGAVTVNSGGLIIGQEQDSVGGGFVASQDWEGLVDEPIIFSNALSASSVNSIYANQLAGRNWDGASRTCPVPPSVVLPAPRAEWRLDEPSWSASADEIKDYSGNGFHSVASESMSTDENGVVCRAVDFSVKDRVTTDYISLDAAAFNGLNEFSFSVWGKSSETGSQALLSGFGPDHGNELLLWFDSSDYFQPLVKNDSFRIGSNGFSIIDFASPANRNQWHHFVYTRKADKNCLYIDGALQGCKYSVATGALRFSPGSVVIGQEQDAFAGGFDISQDWDGWIDEPTLFESELSLAQVSAIYANQTAGKNYDGTDRRCGLPAPVVDYRFDSCNWADARDVVDSGPNGLDAYAVNGVVSTIGGQVCGLAQFDSSDDYVSLSDTNEIDLPDALTAMAWIYLKNTPSELKTILSKDANYEFHVNSNREIFWWWQDSIGNTRSFSSGTRITLNQWHHVAITYRSGLQIIYIDGQEAARQAFSGQLITNNNDLQIGQDQGIESRFFDGDIDEVKLFDTDLSAAEIEDIFVNEVAGRNYDGALRSCNCVEPVSVDHYAVSHDLSMVSCLTENITFTAHDNADLAVDAKGALLQISTSTLKGEWLSVVAGSGVLSNAGNGSATYRFPDNGEGSVTLQFSYPDLASDPEEVNFNVTDGAFSDKRNAASPEDRSLSVSDSGLVFSIPDTESCQSSVSVTLKAVKKIDGSLSCGSAVAGSQAVSFYSQYLAPSTGAKALLLTSSGVAHSLPSAGPGIPVIVNFDPQGEARISVKYSDAGVVGLNAALAVGQKTLSGSDSFVAYPAQLSLAAENASGAVLNNTSVSGGTVWAAARPFTVRVSGQCADGVETLNYQPSNAELGISLHTPTVATGGVGGNFSVSTGARVAGDSVGWISISPGFSSGVFEDASASYSEVGIINLHARDLNYYGHAINQSDKTVGRFTPWYFDVTANSPEWGAHCSSGDFSYMGENIEYQTPPELVVTSFNAVGGRVYNYGGSLWQLAAQRSSRFYTDQSAAVSATLSSTVNLSLDTWSGTESDYDGAAVNTLTADSIAYTRNALEDPFNGLTDLTFSIADLTDSDGACYRVDSDSDGNWLEEGCGAFAISNIPAKELRFGRLKLTDAYGPETEPLSLSWVVEYYSGSDFIINTTDSCSAWLTSEVGYSDNEGALIALGQTAASYAYPGVDFRVEAGDAGVTMSAPGAGSTGVVGVVVDLTRTPYFFFDWDGDGSFDNAPSANLIFGQYRGNDRVIFQRQW